MIQGVITVAGRNALLKQKSGLFPGLQDALSYFVAGEGGALTTGVTDEVYATTTTGPKTFSHTLGHVPAVRGTVTVHDSNSNSATDNGNGALSCSAFSGTVNYKTGAVSITYVSAPGAGVVIEVDYTYRSGPKNPDPTLTETEAEASPSSPTNPSHLAFFKKAFFADSTTTIVFTPGNPPQLLATLFLDVFEFLDDGTGESPYIFEIGIYDTEGVLMAYATMDGLLKNGSTQMSHTATFFA